MSTATIASQNQPAAFIAATRIQRSLVTGAERRALHWLALHTSEWINSDHLTLIGFLSQCLVGVCYAWARFNPAMLLMSIIFLTLNWLGDSLDGTLARVRNRQRPRYGFYVDHIVDTIGAFVLMSGLSVSGYVHPVIGLGMLIAFLMLSIESYLATYTLGRFRLSYWKFGPTEIRILLVIGNLALLRHSTIGILGLHCRLFDLGGIIAIAGMGLFLVVSAIRHVRQLYVEERVP